MDAKKVINDITNLIIDVSKRTHIPLSITDFTVIHQEAGSISLKLPVGKMAVYTFFYIKNGECLKVGQANSKSKARYQSHHYYKDSGVSTLTNSLIKDLEMPMIDSTNYDGWVKNSCERFDVLIDESFGKITLNFIEGLLQILFSAKIRRINNFLVNFNLRYIVW